MSAACFPAIVRRMHADTFIFIVLEAVAVITTVLLAVTILLLAAPGPDAEV